MAMLGLSLADVGSWGLLEDITQLCSLDPQEIGGFIPITCSMLSSSSISFYEYSNILQMPDA